MNRLMLWIGIAATFAVVGCKKSVPRVEGQDLKTATSKLENSGFKVGAVGKTFTGTSDSGTVVSQNPAAATKLAKGSVIDLIIEDSVTLPSLMGLQLPAALQAVGAQGLRVSLKTKPTKDAPAGTVLDQTPLPGRVPPGTPVEVVVAGEEKILQTIFGSGTLDGFRNIIVEGASNRLSGTLEHALDGDHGKGKDKEKNKDTHTKDGKGNGVGKVVGDEVDKQVGKTIDKAIDQGLNKNTGTEIAREVGTDLAKKATHSIWESVKKIGRKDSAQDANDTESSASEPLAAPVQISPYQGESVNAVANRVNFAWSEVRGAASYTVEIEKPSGKKWTKLETKSGLVDTKYSAKVAGRNARWRVRAVDSKRKDGPTSGWTEFALVGSDRNVSTPVQHGPAQVVSK